MPTQPNINYAVNPSDAVTGFVALRVAGPATSAALGTAQFPDGASGDLEIVLGGTTTETFSVTISNDGTNFSAPLKLVQAATGKDAPSAALPGGHYTLPVLRFGSPRFVKIAKSAAVETGAAALAMPIVQRMW